MLYKPRFCCECGEKILRRDWKLWTSRRFCEVCEIDKRGYEVFPKIIGGLLFIFGLFGIGSLILKGETNRELKIERVSFAKKNLTEENVEQRLVTENLKSSSVDKNLRQIQSVESSSISKLESPAQKIKAKLEEPVYYCGAETKKGGFCKRRVKGGGRCWQHQGQQAILPPEKLLVVP
ncbi:MAG: hypothetical protein D6687_06370 [Acidobacteria bacterium]|jgi:hypothetical protein|nr:MAG: hypothetical protein D6687_06370 [Acidobacteriota bacterium]GIU82583.1 MAG: hypothetical protein KatS3mg006_1647 [Pyrinomonadaceae bacterium]